MVNDAGQLYTIEGFAAGLIMLLTAFIVVNSTSVYTPGDTHISDMQLEVIGSDALVMMNTAPNSTIKSDLQTIVEKDEGNAFGTRFSNLVNNRTGEKPDTIHFLANVTYDNPNTPEKYGSIPLNATRRLTGGEHAVHVSQWVIVEKGFPECKTTNCKGKHAALVEVYLWRD